jgi:predicted amidohydrolase YtcJ
LGALSDDARALVDDAAPNAQAVDRLAQETVDVVTSTHGSILRAVVDRFRAIVAQVTATPLLGTGTRRQAVQDAMRRFADEGIRSFTDRAGRRWQLTSSVEMAVRTSVARAAAEAHMRTLSTAGVDLVIVSDAPRECPLCLPWEGRVLAIDGPSGSVRSRSSTRSRTAGWCPYGSPVPSAKPASPVSSIPTAVTPYPRTRPV